jgi:hypothetical protein
MLPVVNQMHGWRQSEMQSYLLAWTIAADREREIERDLQRRTILKGLARPTTTTSLARRLRHLFGLESNARPVSRPLGPTRTVGS